MKSKQANYLDYIPTIHEKMIWKVLEEGIVQITIENTGFYNTLAQKLYKKPRYSFISLDEYGSCVWKQIDGEKTIYDIGQILQDSYKDAAFQLYERLSVYFTILERNKYIKCEMKL